MSNHKLFSLIKSGVRIIACFLGAAAFRHWNLVGEHAFILLGLAEVIGIIEEEFES